MELRFLILLGLTITSSAGFPLPVSHSLLPPGGGSSSSSIRGLRSPGLRERESDENEAPAGEVLSTKSGNTTGTVKVAGPGDVHRRAKRCTCYTYKDKECIYYCHLDIIWINTPDNKELLNNAAETEPYREKDHKKSRSMHGKPGWCFVLFCVRGNSAGLHLSNHPFSTPPSKLPQCMSSWTKTLYHDTSLCVLSKGVKPRSYDLCHKTPPRWTVVARFSNGLP